MASSLSNKFKTFVKNRDGFGQEVKLTVNDEESVKTFPGGFMTICQYIFLIYFIW